MAIKVKHEGNVTSRVVAANMGGQAQSSQQQAAAAAQRAAQENAAANRQLQGAHAAPIAPSAAPLSTGASAPVGDFGGHSGSGGGKSTVSQPEAPLEDRMLVTNNRVNDNQHWDTVRQQWVGPFETGGFLDQKLKIVGTHNASLDRNKVSNAVVQDVQKRINAVAASPKVEEVAEQPVQYDYSGGQPATDQYAELADRFGVPTDGINMLKDEFRRKGANPFQSISVMDPQRVQAWVRGALAEKRRQYEAIGGSGIAALAQTASPQPVASVQSQQSVAPVQPQQTDAPDAFGSYKFGESSSVGMGNDNAAFWDDNRVIRNGISGL